MTSGGSGAWRSRGRREPGGDAESRQANAPVRAIHQDMTKLKVLMDKFALMQLDQRRCDSKSYA